MLNPDGLNAKEMSFLKGCMRKHLRYSDTFKEVYKRNLSRTRRGVRGGKMYHCESCNEVFGSNKLEVHHIHEVVEIDKTITDYTLKEMWFRINCSSKDLKLLCKSCHQKLTDEYKRMKSSYNKYVKSLEKYNQKGKVFFVLSDGSIIDGISNLKSEHKYEMSSIYKTRKGAERKSKQIKDDMKC